MDYAYIAKGGISVFGTTKFKFTYIYPTRFAVGEVVYNRDAAEHHGHLEALVIKKHKLLFLPSDVLYTDTVNGLWNERHLCTQSEALSFVAARQDRMGIEAEQLLGYGTET